MKTRKVGILRVEGGEEAGETNEYEICPVCSGLGSVGEVLKIKNRPNKNITPWDAGGYFCLRCGLKAPSYVWAYLTSRVMEDNDG